MTEKSDNTPTEITVTLPKWSIDYLKRLEKELAFEDLDEALLYITRRYYMKHPN